MVISGTDDPIFPPAHAKDTAANIPGAELRLFPGMGHDLPPVLIPMLVDMIEVVACRARRAN